MWSMDALRKNDWVFFKSNNELPNSSVSFKGDSSVSVNPICHGVFSTFVVMGARRIPSPCSLDWQMGEVCCFCQQVIHVLWTKCHSQIFADVIVLLATSSLIKGTYRNSQFFTYLHGMSYFCMRLTFFFVFMC